MDLSIVIVNWKSSDMLDQALVALENNVRGLSYEVVVIDSGSFDGCGEMLRAKHPGVAFIQSERNLGFARANNEAFRSTRAPIVLFLNPDTEVVGAAVQDLYRTLQRCTDAAIVGPKLLNSDGSLQETCIRAFPTLLNQLLDSDLLRARFPQASLWGKQDLSPLPGGVPKDVEAVSGACLMMRRAVFETVDRFSTDYFMYSEDMDLCLKAARAGFKTLYVPAAVVVHHGGGSSAQAPANNFAAVMRLESQWRFFRKTRSPFYAATYRASMCVASALRITALLVLGLVRRKQDGAARVGNALRKWSARLRWTLGGERWVRNY
jgi:N-acetylglucosaminyl-diphospho-decaprenol L-rhamnosyltransferase